MDIRNTIHQAVQQRFGNSETRIRPNRNLAIENFNLAQGFLNQELKQTQKLKDIDLQTAHLKTIAQTYANLTKATGIKLNASA